MISSSFSVVPCDHSHWLLPIYFFFFHLRLLASSTLITAVVLYSHLLRCFFLLGSSLIFSIFYDHASYPSYPSLLIFSSSIIIARSYHSSLSSPSSVLLSLYLHIITYRSSSIGLHETSSNVWDLSVDPEYLWAIETISMSPLHIQPLKSLRLWH